MKNNATFLMSSVFNEQKFPLQYLNYSFQIYKKCKRTTNVLACAYVGMCVHACMLCKVHNSFERHCLYSKSSKRTTNKRQIQKSLAYYMVHAIPFCIIALT
jgi:hypothetical protein